MQKMVIVDPPPPPTCEPSAPLLANIDFSQPGWWSGDDSPSEPVAVNTLVQASVSYTDDIADSHSVQWSWGDGAETAGAVVDSNGAGTATADHAYAAAGLYAVSAVVKDDCSSATVTRQVVVYDPSAGFVTGGGWITSPINAYPADPSLTGRANFGFVSKYLKGATVPIGQTEFQFQTARLNFHSESYDWMVVAGARAQYKGTGSVNGTGGFKFMLTAVDGALLAGGKGADRFRIKIWHTDASNDDVVDYDNDASTLGGTNEGTALSGGSIVIHK